ncbi:MAG: cytochrome c oxidase subunit 3, partial [Phycisphaeraceae bacterium]
VLIMALGTLIYAYFYLWLYSEQWPQDNLLRPRLVWASLAYGSLLLSGITQVWASYGMRRRHARQIRIASVATLGLGVVFLILQVGALATAGITPTENAYTSAFFATNWLLLIYAAAGVAVLGFLVPRLVWHDVDDPLGLRLHQEIAEVFWLFVVVAGLVTFATTYVSPYVL